MTYPEKLENVVAKKYAFPALLYGIAMIVSIIELAINFGLSKYFMYTSRIVLLSVCIALLIIFAIMHKNVNFYDVISTAILAVVIVADLFCLLSSYALYSIPGRLTTVVDVYPGGIIRFYQILTSSDGTNQQFSEHMYAFSFLALFEGIFLICTAVCSVAEKRHPDKTAAIEKLNRRILVGILIVAVLAAITFILINSLYAAPQKFEKYSPMFV